MDAHKHQQVRALVQQFRKQPELMQLVPPACRTAAMAYLDTLGLADVPSMVVGTLAEATVCGRVPYDPTLYGLTPEGTLIE